MTDPTLSATNAGTDDAGNDTSGGSVPNEDTGAGIGAASEPNTLEPEEDPDAVDDPTN